MAITRRFGKFSVPREVVLCDPPAAHAFLDGVLIVRAELMFASDSIEYTGISDAFREVNEGEEAPWYAASLFAGRVAWKELPWRK